MITGKIFKYNGFTLVEILVTLAISAILITVALPAITRRMVANNADINVLTCVKKEHSSNMDSQACKTAINYCMYGFNQACNTISNLIEHGVNDAERSAARNIMGAACDKGGNNACAYMVTSCMKDSNTCHSGFGNDFEKYLSLAINTDSPAKLPILKYAGSYFEADNFIITNQINNICCNPGLNLACKINGTTTCNPLQLSIDYYRHENDTGKVITLDNDGNIYAAGNTIDDPLYDYDHSTYRQPCPIIIKIDKEHNIKWRKELKASADFVVKGITVDILGNAYLVCSYNASTTTAQVIVIKLSQYGNIIWIKSYNASPYGMQAFGITTDNAGYIYILESQNMHSYDSGGGSTLYPDEVGVIKLKQSNGVYYWGKRIYINDCNTLSPKAIALDKNFNIYIIASQTHNNNIPVIMKINKDGYSGNYGLLWSAGFGTDYPGLDNPRIAVDKDNNIIAIGNNSANGHICIMKLNSNTGSPIWQKDIKNSSGITVQGNEVITDKLGNTYIIGTLNRSTKAIAVIKINSAGNNIIWDKTFNSASNGADAGYGIKVINNGTIYITGSTNDGTSDNMVIAKMQQHQTKENLYQLDNFSQDFLMSPYPLTVTGWEPGEAEVTVNARIENFQSIVSSPGYLIN